MQFIPESSIQLNLDTVVSLLAVLRSQRYFQSLTAWFALPRSGECSSVAEDTERRLVITESACLDKLVVDTDRLSASGNKIKQMNGVRK